MLFIYTSQYLTEVLATRTKIIVLTSYQASARVILCQAYKKVNYVATGLKISIFVSFFCHNIFRINFRNCKKNKPPHTECFRIEKFDLLNRVCVH